MVRSLNARSSRAPKIVGFLAAGAALFSPFVAKAADSPLKNPALDSCVTTALQEAVPGGAIIKRPTSKNNIDYTIREHSEVPATKPPTYDRSTSGSQPVDQAAFEKYQSNSIAASLSSDGFLYVTDTSANG